MKKENLKYLLPIRSIMFIIIFIVGSYITKSEDYKKSVLELLRRNISDVNKEKESKKENKKNIFFEFMFILGIFCISFVMGFFLMTIVRLCF